MLCGVQRSGKSALPDCTQKYSRIGAVSDNHGRSYGFLNRNQHPPQGKALATHPDFNRNRPWLNNIDNVLIKQHLSFRRDSPCGCPFCVFGGLSLRLLLRKIHLPRQRESFFVLHSKHIIRPKQIQSVIGGAYPTFCILHFELCI